MGGSNKVDEFPNRVNELTKKAQRQAMYKNQKAFPSDLTSGPPLESVVNT